MQTHTADNHKNKDTQPPSITPTLNEKVQAAIETTVVMFAIFAVIVLVEAICTGHSTLISFVQAL